jgi:hypothetical protein
VVPNVAPGSYIVRLNPMYGVYIKAVRAGDRELPDGILTVPSGSGDLTIELGMDTGEVSGTVQAADGSPGDRMGVTLALKGSLTGQPYLMRSTTGADGSFQFPTVAPGDYYVFAWETDPGGGALNSAAFVRLFESRGTSVTVAAYGSAKVQVKAISGADIEAAMGRFQ